MASRRTLHRRATAGRSLRAAGSATLMGLSAWAISCHPTGGPGATTPTEPAPAPAAVAAEGTIVIDTDAVLRTFDKRLMLGSNVAIWHQKATFDAPQVASAFGEAGIGLLRLPGGSASDQYFWNGNGVRQGDDVDRSKYDGKNHRWKIDYSDWKPGFNGFWGFPKDPKTAELGPWHGNVNVKEQHEFIQKVKAAPLVTVNAGTGSAKDAAEWVRWSKKMGYGVKYWEVGNELGGAWESGTLRPDGKNMDGEMYGGIYSEFARAMKAVDESIAVGSQGGVDFIRGALARKEAPIDFVTFHDYYNADDTSLEARFATLDRIQKQIADVRQAIDELRPGSDIEIGITEYNCKLFEDEETADVVSGLWTIAAVGEMLYGGLDFATQWDTFTQKKAQGGGHGFMLEDGFVKKAQYWSFYLLNHYLGSELLEVKNPEKSLRVTASKDAEGNLFVIAVNTHATEAIAADFDLGDDPIAPMAEGMTFSRHEYAWDKAAFNTLYNNGPTPLSAAVGSRFTRELPPLSVTALRLSPARNEPTLAVEGTSQSILGVGKKRALRVRVFDAQGAAAPGASVTAALEGATGFTVEPSSAETDAAGVATFSLVAPENPASGKLTLAAAGVSIEHALESVIPELLVHGPSKSSTKENAPFFAALRYATDGGYRLLESYSGAGQLKVAQGESSPVTFRRGLALFEVPPPAAGPARVAIETAGLEGSADVEFFDTQLEEVVALRFDDDKSLQNADGKLKYSINQSVRANQGVLELKLDGAQGWTQDAVNFDKLQDTPGLDRQNIVAVSLDVMPDPGLDTSGQWASFVLVLQSEVNYWMPLEAIDLRALEAGKWNRVEIELSEEQRKAMKAFFKIITVVNSGAAVKGPLYLDNLGFKVETAKTAALN